MNNHLKSLFSQSKTAAPEKRQYKNLAKDIKARLAAGKKPADIARDLGCQLPSVYYHMHKPKKGDRLEGKVKRCCRKYKVILTAQTVIDFTESICAYSGKVIDLEKDDYCLALIDNIPIIYLTEYHRLTKIGLDEYKARCAAILRRDGWQVTPPIN